MWRRAEAIAAVCRDITPAKSSGKASSSSSSSSSSARGGGDGGVGGEDSLAWDEEEKACEPKAEAEAAAAAAAAASAAAAAEAAAAAAETPANDGGGGEEEAAAKAEQEGEEEQEVAIDEAYLGPDSVIVTITGCNEGGLLTSLAGLPAFIPFSQVEAASLGLAGAAAGSGRKSSGRDSSPSSSSSSFSSNSSSRTWLTASTAAPAVGKKVRAVPTEVNAEAERIVLSVKAAVELSARQQLKVGALIWGTVRKAASYGLFVGIDGMRESALLHATNISRGARLPDSPLDVLPLGSRVRALVVGMDEGGRRLSLSTAEIEENDGDMLLDAEKVYSGAEEQALYFRRHLEALAAQEAAGGGGNERRRSNYNNKKGNNNRRYYDDDVDGGSVWSSG